MIAELDVGVEAVKTFADCLLAITNPTRLKIVQYCLEPRKFSDLIFDLKLNPASLKFHSKVLMDCDLIKKRERGIYETTELGKMILKLVEQAGKISSK